MEVKTSARFKDVDPEACWNLLERVAASPQLKRSTRLREFLFYVGGKQLKDGCAEVHEQEIGHVVFGREKHYDTSQDNIVRVNATELRKRIDAFFTSEGTNEPVVFEIPRGSYMPVFRLRSQDPFEPVQFVQPDRRSPLIPLMILVSAVAILLAVCCAVLWTQNHSMNETLHSWKHEPALAAFWAPFLGSHQDTDIILADTSFALVEDITKQSFSLSDYLNRSYLRQIQAPGLSVDRRADLNLTAARPNGSIGDFRVAQRIQALDLASTKLSVQFAREYTADSIKRNNVILVGSQKSNPWVDLFCDQMNFTITYDPNLNQSFVKNLKPQPGEQPMYAAPTNPYASIGYSVIAYLPNPSRTANVLIIEGTDAQATDGAGEFVTSERTMESFLKRLHTKQIPYFEILLRTTRLSGTPFDAEVLGYRTH